MRILIATLALTTLTFGQEPPRKEEPREGQRRLEELMRQRAALEAQIQELQRGQGRPHGEGRPLRGDDFLFQPSGGERSIEEVLRREEAHRTMRESPPEVREKHEQMMRMERESAQLAEKIRRKEVDNPETASACLKEHLDKLFDLREENRVRELTELKRRVGELEKSTEKRKGNKEKIVEKRKKELLGEKDDSEDW